MTYFQSLLAILSAGQVNIIIIIIIAIIKDNNMARALLRRGKLKRETESLLIVIQNNTVKPINW